MKAWSLWRKPFSSEFLLGSRTLEMAVIYAEALLSFWLLLGWAWPLAWLTTVVAFLGFGLHNGSQVWEGHATCGCFGQVAIAPIWTLMLDVVALALLALVRPRRSSWAALFASAAARRLMLPAGSLFLLAAIAAGWFIHQAGSVQAALAELRGDVLRVEPTLADLGTHPAKSSQQVKITLHNRSGQPIRIVGGTTDCSCVATVDLPVTIPAGERVEITLKVRFGGQPGRFQRGYWLWTNSKVQPTAVASWFTGLVKKEP